MGPPNRRQTTSPTTNNANNNVNARFPSSSSSPLRRWCPTHRCRRHTRRGTTTTTTNQTNHHNQSSDAGTNHKIEEGDKATRFRSTRSRARRTNRRSEKETTPTTNNRVIQKGDEIPDASLQYFDHEGILQSIGTRTLCSKGKTIVVLLVPGAFLPTCTNKHLPGFIDLAAQMKQAGCDLIACVSVNDAFVMDAWGKVSRARARSHVRRSKRRLYENIGL